MLKYEGGEDVQGGDILMHKRWYDETKDAKPIRLEVVKPTAFGMSSQDERITVALLSEHPAGFHNHATKSTPVVIGGMSFVDIKDVKFMHPRVAGQSIWDERPKKERYRKEEDEEEFDFFSV